MRRVWSAKPVLNWPVRPAVCRLVAQAPTHIGAEHDGAPPAPTAGSPLDCGAVESSNEPELQADRSQTPQQQPNHTSINTSYPATGPINAASGREKRTIQKPNTNLVNHTSLRSMRMRGAE